MKERAIAVVEKIKNYLGENQTPSSAFYLAFLEKKHVEQAINTQIANLSKLEYLFFLYENRQQINDIAAIEEQLKIDFEHDIKQENLSFIEGAAGILYYFMRVNHPESAKLTTQLAEKVKQTITCVDNIYAGTEAKELEIALGFEGLAGILKVLSKSDDSAVQTIVRRGALFFGEFKNTVIDFKKNDYAMFPRILRTEGNKMKHINSDWLSWAVGDLGIAIAISQVAEQNNDEDLNRTAQLIGFNNILRTEPKSTLITQSFFKNGAVGLAYTYGYLYRQTKIELFQQSYEFWIGKTLEFTEKLIEEGRFFDDLSVMNGATGVALMLESYSNDKDFCHDFFMAD